MSSRKAWMVAASIGAVEALKDQLGFCRWNYGLRSLHGQAKATLVSYQQHRGSKTSSVSQTGCSGRARVKKAEESFDRVMDLSCWGPSSVRF
ncbi:hypothetical protein DCAR_0623665 [Daucus carota subsp. sativus]|uniref:Uncharacterized protein n=1 Tax=Daucus carota subsp. sativus TaxID=79200 RepID=A0A161XC13_DAUCS|nr:hypothetical protein DCAR_0623665 [Daucus carota subsp. sativus]